MQMYIERGYAEPVLESTGAGDRRWFLPYHPVMNPNKLDKVRIVFDCASRCLRYFLKRFVNARSSVNK